MHSRYYDLASGRFISEDSAISGHDWFTYCDNDPVNFIDGNGMFKTPEGRLTYAYDTFMALGCTDIDQWSTVQVDALEFLVFGVGATLLSAIAAGLNSPAAHGIEAIAIVPTAAYSTILVAGLFWCYEGSGGSEDTHGG